MDLKQRALSDAITTIEKSYGKGAIMRLGEAPSVFDVGIIPTGSLALDIALGAGGIPRGRVTEIYGQESSGKTTLAQHILANSQRAGGIVAFIDAEHALDPTYSRALGLDVDELLVSQPDTGEQALEIADALIRSGAIDALAIDSVAALVPRAELEGEMGDSHMGLQARLMSQALRKLSGSLSRSSTAAIFINQIRERIGILFGNPETTPGGRALKFWASVRIEIRRGETIKRANEVVGMRVKARVVKNKIAPPFRHAEFDILFGRGIWREGDLVDSALGLGLITKSGTWYSLGDERLGQGRENACEFLVEHPEVAGQLEESILERAQIRRPVVEAAAPG